MPHSLITSIYIYTILIFFSYKNLQWGRIGTSERANGTHTERANGTHIVGLLLTLHLQLRWPWTTGHDILTALGWTGTRTRDCPMLWPRSRQDFQIIDVMYPGQWSAIYAMTQHIRTTIYFNDETSPMTGYWHLQGTGICTTLCGSMMLTARHRILWIGLSYRISHWSTLLLKWPSESIRIQPLEIHAQTRLYCTWKDKDCNTISKIGCNNKKEISTMTKLTWKILLKRSIEPTTPTILGILWPQTIMWSNFFHTCEIEERSILNPMTLIV